MLCNAVCNLQFVERDNQTNKPIGVTSNTNDGSTNLRCISKSLRENSRTLELESHNYNKHLQMSLVTFVNKRVN